MAKPKAPDPVAWAKSVKRDRGGPKCMTCANPAISSILTKWVAMWRDGTTEMSIPQARAFLVKYYGYTGQPNTLRRCIVTHHGMSPRA